MNDREKAPHPWLGPWLLASLTLFWGANWPAIKLSVAEVSPWTYRSICLGIGAAGLFLIARGLGHRLSIPRQEIRPLLVAAFGNITLWHLCSAAGVIHMEAGRASILAFTMPIWAALIGAIWLKTKLDRTIGVALIFGLAGLVALILPDWTKIAAHPLGPLFMLAAAIGWAFGTIALKAWRFTMPITTLAAWQMLLGGLPIFLGTILFDRSFDPAVISHTAWIAIAYSALIPMIYCHWAWFRIVSLYPAVIAAIGTLAIPVVGVLSGALLAGDRLSWDIFLALGLILAALFMVLIWPQIARRST